MGNKVNPNGIRLGITHDWTSSWYASKEKYTSYILLDVKVREKLMSLFKNSGVAKIEIERPSNKVVVTIHTSKPGVLIGKQGTAIQDVKMDLEKEFKEKFEINIKEIKKPYLNAYIVAELVGQQISRRVAYRRAVKSVLEKVVESGAKGVKIYVGGRLNGVEIARSEYFSNGKVPLHTLRADIDYAHFDARTIYGIIGIKVWIYKGDIFSRSKKN